MSGDATLHFSSNSSNHSDQSLPSKMAKLEARLVGKTSTSTPVHQAWASPSTVKFGPVEDLSTTATSSDTDDTGGEFLIQANTSKRQRLQDDDISGVLEHAKVDTKDEDRIMDNVKTKGSSVTRRKNQSRGRGNSSSGKGRGSRSEHNNNQTKAQLNTGKEHMQNGNHSLLEEEIVSLRLRVATLEDDMRKSNLQVSSHKNAQLQLEKELKDLKDQEEQTRSKRMKVLSDLLISAAKAERREARIQVQQDCLRLGNVVVLRAGTVISETWEDGQALKDINSQLRELLEEKESVERQRKSSKKRQAGNCDGGGDGDAASSSQEDDMVKQDEIYKFHLAHLKRKEETLVRERERCELDKGRLIREMKRIRDEDGSRFNGFPILNKRYNLLNLLGKGGFSEVYRAFDLLENRHVACKLHSLNASWSEEKKQSYMRHAIREYNIHRSLVHSHIVRLWDTFEIDRDTFCTVLEYCGGKDLDAVLKATPSIPESQARIIIVQIFHGLVYLNSNRSGMRVIHYDLKPGNVLFGEFSVAKVTDFGLSKIVDDDAVGSHGGMELTSQGAGTYWYLPPECFDLTKTPFISSKVDVWSAGVILYQMLFGRRPFGHDQSQERILREDTIIKARRVEFPSRPSVSAEVKDFIRRCLTYDQSERPDVLTIAQDPYLKR